MNAKRRHLIKKVMDTFIQIEGIDVDSPKYRDFKKHLESFTDEEIEHDLDRLLNP
jgi:hypothetical protein